MPANTPEEWRLSELNQSVEQIQSELVQLNSHREALARTASRDARRLRYLRTARWVRKPAESLALWPIGVATIGPILVGAALLIVAQLIFGSLSVAVFAFLLGAAAGGAALAMLLFRPADSVLPAAIEEAEASSRLSGARLKEIIEQITASTAQCNDLMAERRELMASGKVQKAALLQREWKTMAEAEWEDFVVEVCRTLGASVDRLPRTSEKDANLIARFGDRSVALVTAGEGRTANSGAVQHALAGQKRHRCDRCAVVINRRLTGAAQDFAKHNGCTAIGVDEFPDFVMGKIEGVASTYSTWKAPLVLSGAKDLAPF